VKSKLEIICSDANKDFLSKLKKSGSLTVFTKTLNYLKTLKEPKELEIDSDFMTGLHDNLSKISGYFRGKKYNMLKKNTRQEYGIFLINFLSSFIALTDYDDDTVIGPSRASEVLSIKNITPYFPPGTVCLTDVTFSKETKRSRLGNVKKYKNFALRIKEDIDEFKRFSDITEDIIYQTLKNFSEENLTKFKSKLINNEEVCKTLFKEIISCDKYYSENEKFLIEHLSEFNKYKYLANVFNSIVDFYCLVLDRINVIYDNNDEHEGKIKLENDFFNYNMI